MTKKKIIVQQSKSVDQNQSFELLGQKINGLQTSTERQFKLVHKNSQKTNKQIQQLIQQGEVNSQGIQQNTENIAWLITYAKDTEGILQRLVKRAVDTDETTKQLVTSDEFNNFKQELLTRLDAQAVTLQRLDQERVFTTMRIDKIERHVHLA